MTELINTNDQASVKTYFETVYHLAKEGKEFPINLDEVWPLVYADKAKAVRALRRTFIEGIDYQSLTRNGEQKTGRGGQNEIGYYLSLPCFEFFIARKVRQVFEVYRRMFHQVSTQLDTAQTQLLIAEYGSRINKLETMLTGVLEREEHRLELPHPDVTRSVDTVRSQVVMLLQQQAEQMNLSYYKAWNQLYDKLHLVYGFNIRVQRKTQFENLLDVAERHGQLERLFTLLDLRRTS